LDDPSLAIQILLHEQSTPRAPHGTSDHPMDGLMPGN
jgi:hypothetical protein